MKLIPLGGAEEIGATCTMLEIGGHKLLVDAGIRLGQPDPLPDLSRLTDFGGIEAIILTHAHTDHTGALPVVHRAYPTVPVYATPGTQAITHVLMSDALNLMKSRYELDREIPLYNRELVDSLFTRMQPVQLGQTIKLFGGDLAVSFFPAGHILGAACIGFQAANGESAFISGDFSVTPQLTVGGMLAPISVDRTFHPQVVMVESTYGNRLHANRTAEERRLTETVAQVVEAGGRVLIPAFAVGRAQEVLLILARAMARKAIAPFPVWVDGMVRSVCSVYTQHPYDLANAVRKQILARGNPFFGENAAVKEAEFEAITTPEERKKIAEEKKPGVIVASSGMLSGGPSAFYARYIVRESDSAIFITGYQDEESPGRALLDLAEATKPEERTLKLDGEPVPVVCRVEKYSLSAHADAGEVSGLVEQLNPQETVLVHGAGGAREALSDLLVQTKDRRIYLPSAGDELGFAPRGKKRRLPAQVESQTSATTAFAPEEGGSDNPVKPRPTLPDAPTTLAALREKVLERWGQTATHRTFTTQEIFQMWLENSGNSGEWSGGLNPDEYHHFRKLLSQKESGFVSDSRRPFLFRLAKQETLAKNATDQFPLEQNAALALVEKLFPPSTGLYRRGALTLERKLVLYFNFPETAPQKYSNELAELSKLSGWSVELNAETHQGALGQTLRELLPASLLLLKPPGIYRESRTVKANFEYVGTDKAERAAELAKMTETFKAETGWSLDSVVETAEDEENLTPSSSPEISGQRMEINAAFQLIETAFYKIGVELYRKSRKVDVNSEFIELGFVTAQVGKRYQAVLSELEQQVGWPLRINPEPHHQALQKMGEQALREADVSRYAIRGWSIFRDKQELGVKLGPLDKELDREAIQGRFQELTGWKLKL